MAIIAAAIACGSADEAVSSSGDTAISETSRELIIYSGRSESLVDPILQRFEEVSGIDVKVRYGSTGALAATLLEEGDRTPADVFFAQDPGGLGAISEMLIPISTDVLNLVPEWARSPDSTWIGTSGRARVVVYNTENVSVDELPTNIEGFTDSKWKGRIGWPPSNGSFQAMVTGMRIIWGEQRTQDWLEGILANEPVIYAKNAPTVQAVSDGEVDVGFVNHYYLHRFIAEQGDDFPARNYYLPDGGPGSVVLVAGLGVIDPSSPAEEFIRFLLSKESQQYFADETFEHPLIAGVATQPGIPDIDSLARPTIDISDLGDLESTQALLRKTGVLP
ncbi:MAG: iron ABC transporter substrate-binding protein [Chloroflexi bacterium]|nr:iron ABC transporter substrate-binding protein [Chloroflexota bacterium]